MAKVPHPLSPVVLLTRIAELEDDVAALADCVRDLLDALERHGIEVPGARPADQDDPPPEHL